jgi:hypothetical protein
VEDCEGKLKYPVDTNVVWLDLRDDVASAVGGIAKDHSLLMRGSRLMMHYRKFIVALLSRGTEKQIHLLPAASG